MHCLGEEVEIFEYLHASLSASQQFQPLLPLVLLTLLVAHMKAKYFLPYFLEDQTGRLTGSEFIDLHDRMSLIYRRCGRDATRPMYVIYDKKQKYSCAQIPFVALEFGPDDSLGTITFPGDGRQLPMEDYLTKLSPLSLYVFSYMIRQHEF